MGVVVMRRRFSFLATVIVGGFVVSAMHVVPPSSLSAHAQEPAASELAAQIGAELRDDRLLVSAGTRAGPVTTSISEALGFAAAATVAAEHPMVFDDAETAYAYLLLFPEPHRTSIVEAAGVSPDDINFGWREYWRGLNEFDRRALHEVIVADASDAVTALQLPFPVPVLILCDVSVREYDFDQQHFPIERGDLQACDSVRLSSATDMSVGGVTVSAPIATERLPGTIPVAVDQARDFRREHIEADGSSSIVYGITAQLAGMRANPGSEHQFEIAVEPEEVLLFSNDDIVNAFARFPLNPKASEAVVPARPVAPLFLNDQETLDLVLLSQGLISLDERAQQWMRSRAANEGWDQHAGWQAFFHEDIRYDVAVGNRDGDQELRANFADWSRRRAAALPDVLHFTARESEIDRLTRLDNGDFAPLVAGSSSERSDLEEVAGNVGLVDAYVTKLWGHSLADVALQLPGPAAGYTFQLDDAALDSDGAVAVVVDARLGSASLETSVESTATTVVKVEPLAIRVIDRDGHQLASVSFDAVEWTTEEATRAALEGVWAGVYDCYYGPTGAEVSLQAVGGDRFAGEFSFFAPPENPAVEGGRFAIAGQYHAPTGQIRWAPRHWIEEPPDDVMVGAAASLDDGHATISVFPDDSSCGDFELVRGDWASLADRVEAAHDAEVAELGMADVLGIHLGMTFEEADRIIRDHMDVGWVAEDAVPDDEDERLQRHLEPYREFMFYLRSDGQEAIALFGHREVTNEVLGISRTVSLSPGTSFDVVAASLKDKYGDEPSGHYEERSMRRLTWTVGQGYTRDDCNVQMGSQIRFDDLRVLEGPTDNYGYPDIGGEQRVIEPDVWGAKTRGDSMETWDSDRWAACGPQITAAIREDKLQVGVFDLVRYAASYKQHTADATPVEAVAGPKL